MGFSQPATGTPRVALPYSAMMPLSKKIQLHQRLLSAPLILGEDRGQVFLPGIAPTISHLTARITYAPVIIFPMVYPCPDHRPDHLLGSGQRRQLIGQGRQ